MLADLKSALADLPIVRDVRGLGLMLAIELRTKVAPVLKSLMLENRVIALPAGPTILRLLPPLVISDEEIALGVTAIAAALEAASTTPARRSAATAS
jgi:acetylornithine/LysW-gamma-L-lysine aminotransferase